MIPIKALVHCMNNSNINVSNVYENIQSLSTNNLSDKIVALLLECVDVFDCELRWL